MPFFFSLVCLFLVQLELKKILMDRFLHLMSFGYALPVLKFILQCTEDKSFDRSVLRHFVSEVRYCLLSDTLFGVLFRGVCIILYMHTQLMFWLHLSGSLTASYLGLILTNECIGSWHPCILKPL